MNFTADKQTLEDLNILGKFKHHSVFGIFNHLQTRGGERLLEDLFRNPLTDHRGINARSALFAFFQEQQLAFPLSKAQFDSAESYLSGGNGASQFLVALGILAKKCKQYVLHDAGFLQLQAGLSVTIETLQVIHAFFERLSVVDLNGYYKDKTSAAHRIFHTPQLAALISGYSGGNMSLMRLIRNDYVIRHLLAAEMKELLHIIYHLDLCLGVTAVSREKGFSYARALPKKDNRITILEFRHPGLENGVPNSLAQDQDLNILFLTGANMAGKSTFMKSFGIAVYLAHMGFPVAAQSMEFSVKDGLFSSINVSDNLNMGYSHFYAEVLRVKQVAQAVSESRDLFVIFDELFKGTNVKDAYDATLAVTEAFGENRNCFFIISTHIIEVGEVLRERGDNLQFRFLETIMDGNVPTYPYKLKEGITADRHGMIIIENEKILEIIEGKLQLSVTRS